MQGFTWLRNQPLTFINCNGQEERSTLSTTAGGGTSYLNDAEAQAAVDAVQQLLNCATSELQAQDIGVITPYSGQVRHIRTLLERSFSTATISKLDVKTVDGFQGQEKEVIIFSAVRCNQERRVGFLADARRLNVALTRAKRGLIVIGCRSTLQHDSQWRSWLRWTAQQGLDRASEPGKGQGQCQDIQDDVKASIDA